MSEPYSMPSGPPLHSAPGSGTDTDGRSKRKPWHSRLPFISPPPQESDETLTQDISEPVSRDSGIGNKRWWKTQLFKGMSNDIRRRAPFFWSDWKDAWDYRVVPATIYMYFAKYALPNCNLYINASQRACLLFYDRRDAALQAADSILPALAFSLDMFAKTASSFGVNEVLLASVLGAVVFSVFACQPLVIVGVTGPITVFNYTVYDIIVPRGTNYFAFMCWIGLWSMVMHWILAVVNSCNGLTYVTRFSCDTFGFYVAFIYLQKGIQVLTRQWETGEPAAYLSIVVALLVLMVAYICGAVGASSLFQRYVRKFIEDYGTPLTLIFFTGFVHIGRMSTIEVQSLPTSRAFFPTQDRGWFVHFWDIDVADVFIAIPFAILLTILFWFDHNGLLGIPFPNGLIPQAPFHTNALCVTRQVTDESETGANKGHTVRVVDHVVEQRVSNLAQGLLTLGTMSGPLLVVIHLIPQGVLAGLFFVMGIQALEGNGITLKMLYLARDQSLTNASDPLSRIQRKQAIWYFVAIELVGFGATFAITQTIAAIGFPVFILLLIPVRTFLFPKYFTQEELSILDAPTASPFTMESVGGNYGEDVATPLDRSGGVDRPQSSEGSHVDDSTERGEAEKTRVQKLHPAANSSEGDGTLEGESYELQQQRSGREGLSHRSQSRNARSLENARAKKDTGRQDHGLGHE
ncbi:MAG: hypothetical protein Q9174_001342 [Haloplaca sp. 1 TL-2023]